MPVSQRDGRVRGLEVEAGGELPRLQGEQDLEQADDARGALQVADVRLGRADLQGCVRLAGGAEDRGERRGLDGVADGCAGAVEFDVLDILGAYARRGVRAAEYVLLGLLAGGGEAVTAAVVDGAAAQHAVDVVAVPQRLRQGLEEDEAAALAPYVAVGAGVEGVAAAVGGEPAEPGDAQGAVEAEVEVHPAGEGDLALSRAEALACHVDGDQGGRLARIDGEAGAVHAEEVGQPVGDHASLQTGESVVRDRLRTALPGEGRIVVVHRADEDAGAQGGHAFGGDAAVLQQFPAEFQREALLGVHGRCLARRDAEEVGVELIDPVEESASFGD